jgi:hypothetical protein
MVPGLFFVERDDDGTDAWRRNDHHPDAVARAPAGAVAHPTPD